MKTKLKSLANCTYSELCRFEYDHVDCGKWHIHLSEIPVVIIGSWPNGTDIEMPRHVFNRLVAGYLKPKRFVRKAIKP